MPAEIAECAAIASAFDCRFALARPRPGHLVVSEGGFRVQAIDGTSSGLVARPVPEVKQITVVVLDCERPPF